VITVCVFASSAAIHFVVRQLDSRARLTGAPMRSLGVAAVSDWSQSTVCEAIFENACDDRHRVPSTPAGAWVDEAPAAGARVARIQNDPSSSQRERASNGLRRIKTKHVEAPV